MAFHAVRDGSGSIIGFVTVAIFRADILQRSLNLVLLFSLVLGACSVWPFCSPVESSIC